VWLTKTLEGGQKRAMCWRPKGGELPPMMMRKRKRSKSSGLTAELEAGKKGSKKVAKPAAPAAPSHCHRGCACACAAGRSS